MLSKLREVFTKEYREETEYYEFMGKMFPEFKLNNKSEDVEEKVKRLKDKGFVSNFNIKIGAYK